jgi:hypothetical protein
MIEGCDCAKWRGLEDQASRDAAAHSPDAAGRRRIAVALANARRRLGGDDVRVHTVGFEPGKWKLDSQALGCEMLAAGEIRRSDVFATGDVGSWRLFCLSYIWGQGDLGYGPARFDRIIDNTPRVRLITVVDEAVNRLRGCGPLSAYDYLRGDAHRCAVPYWGPAFFTKFLYFADTASGPWKALILDQRVAREVADLSRMPHFVNRAGKARRWTAFRYGVYLAWMAQTSAQYKVQPDLLEYALFLASQ